jgi:hypothetical protein
MLILALLAVLPPAAAKSLSGQPATAICGRAVTAEYIVGYPETTSVDSATRWGGKQRAALATSLTKSLAKLCKQKLVTPMMFHDEQRIVFMENDNANIISIWSVDPRSKNKDADDRWQPYTLYVEVPFIERFTPKALDPEMRRAILCSYNKDAKELDEIACLPD